MVSNAKSGILRFVRPNIRELLGYEPIEPGDLLAERLGIAPERVAKLDGNENPYGPSPKAIEALAAFDGYHQYSDPKQRRLRAALGEYAGIAPDCVVAGAGSDELIDLILRAVIEPGDAAIVCPPTFGMYSFLTQVAGGRTIDVPLRDDFSLDLGGIEAVGDGAKAIFLPSPNNPTGRLLATNELDALLATELLVVIDEAYVEFGGESCAQLVTKHENLVVLRTFSKWAGLAGLRAGYGIMTPAFAGVLMHMKQPYSPNVAAEVAMLASLEDRHALMRNVERLVQERDRMAKELRALEFVEVYPSEANFVLCRLDGMDGRGVRDRLAQDGVFVRSFDTERLRDCVRISAGRPEDTDRVVEGLREIGEQRGS